MREWLLVDAKDNVAVALRDLQAGTVLEGCKFTLREDIKAAHKFATKKISAGASVCKYGYSIGVATRAIDAGEWVHTHNVRTNISENADLLCGILKNNSNSLAKNIQYTKGRESFWGYLRSDGKVGVRNELWIITTVGCINKAAERAAAILNEKYSGSRNFDGAVAVTHPYGCSQLGEDFADTRRILTRLAEHPNAGACVILGLGCENNTIKGMQAEIQRDEHIEYLSAQDVADEVHALVELGDKLIAEIMKQCRSEQPLEKLSIGLKCGGSDGLSGITANYLVGRISDVLVAHGGSTVLTETPEMFGAEEMLFSQAADEGVLRRAVEMIKHFKDYYQRYGLPVYENPSPGNKDGGITTLEEKSLGCVQKGGKSAIVDVLLYGEKLAKRGLCLLYGPGNDMVAATALAAAGCQMILFTTGRGTPYGTIVPTLKISSNSDLARRKVNWIDFDAGRLLADDDEAIIVQELMDEIIAVADGKNTKTELNGYREIAIFKTGVTL